MLLRMNGESSWCANICPRPRLTTCSNCLKLTIRIIFRTCNLQIILRPITSFQQGIKADSVDEQTGHCTYFRSSKFWVQFQVFLMSKSPMVVGPAWEYQRLFFCHNFLVLHWNILRRVLKRAWPPVWASLARLKRTNQRFSYFISSFRPLALSRSVRQGSRIPQTVPFIAIMIFDQYKYLLFCLFSLLDSSAPTDFLFIFTETCLDIWRHSAMKKL